ncbi:WecB/TagA/CpsF family glycosyltransferase [Geminicoccaceae bacterium 1502E]|nr:WecB/TagA/CpsF family glycosyltransferase [Geminicoccaceae bacterium 1502E]
MTDAGSACPESAALPAKLDIAGVPISLTSYDELLETLDRRSPDRAFVVAVCTVHSIMSARRDPALHAAIARADVATTDGVPLVWMARLLRRPGQTRVYGPELMFRALQQGVARGWRHYLYGTTPQTLERLRAAIERFAPGALVVGHMAPPFRELTPAEMDATIAELRSSAADMIWVGLGMPRQEKWMHRVAPFLPGKALLGVGAAFDFLSGTVPQAPPALQRAGLEWAFRLWHEPRRLWRRYALNNPLFVVLAAGQLIRCRLAVLLPRRGR